MRNCKDCGTVIIGRSDKVFCSGYCRSAFYYNKFRSDSPVTRKIVSKLHRNRRILLEIVSKSKTSSIPTLTTLGFEFKYNTHQGITNLGVIYYCFDVGYRLLDVHAVEIIHPAIQ